MRGWFNLRRVLGIIHDEDEKPVGYPDSLIGRLFECFWCLAFWVSGIVTFCASFVLVRSCWFWFAAWMATAAGSVIIEKFVMRSHSR
jgi:hypothetical protein